MNKIDKITYMGREFQILKDERGFWAIESKYIKNGKLTKEFNGISGLLSKTAEDAKSKVRQRVEIDALVASGMDATIATIDVINRKGGK